MSGDKIETLNFAIRESIPLMQQEAHDNANAQVLVRAVKFSSGAQWHISQPTPVDDFKWTDLSAGGVTDMGRALSMVGDALKVPPMETRALPPVLVLITDGHPTDGFATGLKALMREGWGIKAVRIGIAIGQDADREVLLKFTGNSERVLEAGSPEALVGLIKWATTVIGAVSKPMSQAEGGGDSGVNVPIPVPEPAPSSAGDVW